MLRRPRLEEAPGQLAAVDQAAATLVDTGCGRCVGSSISPTGAADRGCVEAPRRDVIRSVEFKDISSRGAGMSRFVEGQDRSQVALIPECLDDVIAEDNPVRVVDAFVQELDLSALGFKGTTPAATGRPSYDPAVLLKIYIYGYLSRVQSSRRLERECQRNVELMWLTGRLAPDFKTIADFRRENGKGIGQACSQFVMVCRKLAQVARGWCGGRGRQQVQGGQQPRPQLHAAQTGAAHEAGPGKHQAAPGDPGHGRPNTARGSAGKDRTHPGQAGEAETSGERSAPGRPATAPAARPAVVIDGP